MTDNTLTLYLDGDVPLTQFAETIRHFSALVDLLTREVAEDAKIEWIIEDLQGGSALASVVGVSEDENAVTKVVSAYTEVGRSLQRNEPIPFSNSVAREAIAITQAINEKIQSVSFQTEQGDSIIYGVFGELKIASSQPVQTFGAVKGKVEMLSSRGKLKFTLYDPIFDKPINCYIKDDKLQQRMKEIWGRNVVVFGRVTREPESGRAVSVRDITKIEDAIYVEPGSYKQARGVFNWTEGDEPAEAIVRRIRDVQ